MARTPRRLARGSAADVAAYKGPDGEPVYNRENKTIHMQDGVNFGGTPLAKKSETINIANSQLAAMLALRMKGALVDGPPIDLTGAQAWGILGAAGKATQAQAEAGTDNEQFMTALRAVQSNIAQHSGLLSPSGWEKSPSGLIIQWGYMTGPAGGVRVILPISFPNNIYVAITQIYAAPNSSVMYSSTIADMDTSSFSVVRTYSSGGVVGSSGEAFWWIAIGR